MSRRFLVVGLAALCALALSAVAASGASAESAVTCVSGGGTASTNSDCVPGSTGTFGHVAFTGNTQLLVNGVGNQVLSAELFGAEIKLTATGLHCANCMGRNAGGHVVGGEEAGEEGKLVYTGVTTNLPGCSVKGSTVTTTNLKFHTLSATSARIEPKAGTVLAVITLEGGSCELAGEFPVEGHATGTVSGAFLKVNTAPGELTLLEEPAKLAGEATLEAGVTGSGTTHAVAVE